MWSVLFILEYLINVLIQYTHNNWAINDVVSVVINAYIQQNMSVRYA